VEAIKRVHDEVIKLRDRLERLESSPGLVSQIVADRNIKALAMADTRMLTAIAKLVEQVETHEERMLQLTTQLNTVKQELNLMRARAYNGDGI
jgi:hypothetical protein